MNFSKFFLISVVSLCCAAGMNAGAPPTVMFLPDKTWCNQNNYVDRFEKNGKTRIVERYDEAFLNTDLKNVVTQLNVLMQDNGLPAKDYGTTSELDDEEEAEEDAYNSDTQSGAKHQATDYEQLISKLRPDIIIKVGWDVNKAGFNYTVDYRLEAIDSYSGKSIAGVTASTPSMKMGQASLAQVLKSSATEHMGAFIRRLQDHFDDLQTNGREITVACRIGNDGGDINFNTEFGGKKLSTIISDWMNENTVNHAFSLRSSSRNRINFEQVRIPFKDAQGNIMQATQFIDELENHLRSVAGLKSENATKGLGTGRLYDICQ